MDFIFFDETRHVLSAWALFSRAFDDDDGFIALGENIDLAGR
ncbi:hypothetical protein [Agrobacterium tumefaciens]|nr:hypothetical protein [Agrobacterium tumefaciens]